MTSIEEVVSADNCIGCGACAFAAPDAFEMRLQNSGHWQPTAKAGAQEERRSRAASVCPMSSGPLESEIAATLYGDLPEDPQIGRWRRNVAGWVNVADFRSAGGSGGLISWVLAELLRRGDVDAVIHVKPANPAGDDELLFEYGVSYDSAGVVGGAKSRYYPIQLAEVLAEVGRTNLRYAVVGVPCFIKAIRLLQRDGLLDPSRTPFCIGLVCGHLKSRYFAEYLAWQKDALPGTLRAFDFRRKLMDRPASDYGFAMTHVKDGSAVEETWPMASVNGRDWGEGLFKNPACEFCDDVLAECADLAVGDAWLPEYVADPRGTNVATVRSAHLDAIVREGEMRGDITLFPLTPADIAKSQAAGLRHRREGLAHRLARRAEAGQWAPQKRVAPALARDPARRRVYDLRLEIARTSSQLFAEARRARDLAQFQRAIAPVLGRYHAALRGPLLRRILRRAAGKLRRLARRA
jgi:coenzyme F420-reducing hydrogenase beta subunit